MNNAGVMPLGFALPILGLIQSFVNLFASDKDEEKEKDDKFVDDLDDEEDDSLFGKKEDDEKDEDDDSEEEKPKKDSAIVQKQKYRDLYKKTSKELADIKAQLDKKDDKADDPAKAKQEKEAKTYLKGLISELLDERSSKEEQSQKELDDQMEELLEDNDDLTEKQVTEVVEELGVTPKQAVAAIRREQKANGEGKKAKPNVPRSKRGGDGNITEKKSDDKKGPTTLEQASEMAKKRLKELNSR